MLFRCFWRFNEESSPYRCLAHTHESVFNPLLNHHSFSLVFLSHRWKSNCYLNIELYNFLRFTPPPPIPKLQYHQQPHQHPASIKSKIILYQPQATRSRLRREVRPNPHRKCSLKRKMPPSRCRNLRAIPTPREILILGGGGGWFEQGKGMGVDYTPALEQQNEKQSLFKNIVFEDISPWYYVFSYFYTQLKANLMPI